ncbi:hypothetical protein [Variovorax sp. JS1663]|uniref:hypothetical protein n=1 Tax=Variovorax sp. JS1663 TaxID=1851577 RepID=UPI000B346BD2|nr:hypothetical protein [Variovorax sp. JS1663]OUM00024.1 hypothetical protein A8M77_23645 [Variovorax sp. JS1663]
MNALRSSRLLPLAAACTLAVLAALGTGCANNPYLESKRYTATGGQMEQEQNTASAQLASAQATNTRLQSDAARRKAEIDSNAQRIRTLEGELRSQNAQLDEALRARRISQSRHAQLKREIDAIRSEAQNVQLENEGARMSGASDPKAEAAKRERLQQLEGRKKQLQEALSALRAG